MALLDLARRLKAHVESKWRHRHWTPAWTSPEEQNYLADYAQRQYRGVGEIADLGCLLGATTLALGRGLEANGAVSNKAGRIHSYDRFLWEEVFSTLPGGFSRPYQPGESFFPEFQARTAKYARFIKAYPGDITTIGWSGAPIEFLLVDVNKSWELCEFIGKRFYPHLLVNESCILEQDFKHYYTPWVHILNYRLRSVLRPDDELAGTCSRVFRPIKPIDPAMVPSAEAMKAVGKEELDEIYAYSLSIIPNGVAWEKANVIASKVMFYIHTDRAAEARATLDAALSQGFTMDSDLKVCASLLAETPVR